MGINYRRPNHIRAGVWISQYSSCREHTQPRSGWAAAAHMERLTIYNKSPEIYTTGFFFSFSLQLLHAVIQSERDGRQ